MKDGLIALTVNAEWKVNGADGTFQATPPPVAMPQSYNGCSDVQPLVSGSMMKRRDYRLDLLLEGQEKSIVQDLFMSAEVGWHYDDEMKAFVPDPVREFPLVDYRKVQQYE